MAATGIINMTNWLSAQVLQVVPLTRSILQIIVQPEVFVTYQAGQYLQLRTSNFQNFFSIANAPLGSNTYELHVKHDSEKKSSQDLLAHLEKQAGLEISLPHGHCYLDNFAPDRDFVFIAGGTGIAPIKAIIEQMLFNQDRRNFELYWTASDKCDFYMKNMLHARRENVPNFRVLEFFSGSSGLIDNLLRNHKHKLQDLQFMLSGPFDMVYAYRDKLVNKNVATSNIYSDAFAFELKK